MVKENENLQLFNSLLPSAANMRSCAKILILI